MAPVRRKPRPTWGVKSQVKKNYSDKDTADQSSVPPLLHLDPQGLEELEPPENMGASTSKKSADKDKKKGKKEVQPKTIQDGSAKDTSISSSPRSIPGSFPRTSSFPPETSHSTGSFKATTNAGSTSLYPSVTSENKAVENPVSLGGAGTNASLVSPNSLLNGNLPRRQAQTSVENNTQAAIPGYLQPTARSIAQARTRFIVPSTGNNTIPKSTQKVVIGNSPPGNSTKSQTPAITPITKAEQAVVNIMDTPEKSQQPSKLVNEKIPPKSKGKKVSTAYSIVTPTTTIIQGPPIIEDATKSENTLENSQPEAPNDSTSPDVDDGSGSATDVETGGSSCDSETAAPVPPIPNPMGLKNQKYVATFNKIHEKLIACEKGRKVGRSTAPVDAAQATSQVTKAPTQEVQNSAECVEPPMKPQDPSKGKKKVTVSRKAGGPEKIVQQKVIANEAVASTLTTAAPENSKPAAKTQGPSGSPQKPAGPRPLDGQVKLENSIGEASIDNAAQVSSSHGAALTDGVAPPPAADPEPTPSVTSSDYNEPLPGFGLESTECPGLLACTHGIFQAHLHEPPVMPEQSRTFLEVESKLLGVLRHYQSIVDPLPSTVAFIDGLQTTHVKLVALASERISNIVAVMAAAVLWRTWNWLDILAQGKDLEITVASLDSVKSTLDEIELLYMCDNVGFDPWWGGFGQWLNEDYRNIPGKSTENPEYEEKVGV